MPLVLQNPIKGSSHRLVSTAERNKKLRVQSQISPLIPLSLLQNKRHLSVPLVDAVTMGFFACRMVILLVCIGFLSIEMVYGLRSIDLAVRWDKGQVLILRNLRILKAIAAEDVQKTKLNIAPSPSKMFDPNQSSKRRVRRGPDPIHNKC